MYLQVYRNAIAKTGYTTKVECIRSVKGALYVNDRMLYVNDQMLYVKVSLALLVSY